MIGGRYVVGNCRIFRGCQGANVAMTDVAGYLADLEEIQMRSKLQDEG